VQGARTKRKRGKEGPVAAGLKKKREKEKQQDTSTPVSRALEALSKIASTTRGTKRRIQGLGGSELLVGRGSQEGGTQKGVPQPTINNKPLKPENDNHEGRQKMEISQGMDKKPSPMEKQTSGHAGQFSRN